MLGGAGWLLGGCWVAADWLLGGCWVAADWLLGGCRVAARCVTQAFSTTCAVHIEGIEMAGGCLAGDIKISLWLILLHM